MPFYIGDYLRDTGHLTLEQHGAYVLLIMHYWTHGGLPDDPVTLKRLLGLQGQGGENRWRSICLAIAPFFQQPGWKHKRIDAELKKQEEVSTKRKIAGAKGGLSSRGLTNVGRFVNQAIAEQTGTQSQSHKKKKEAQQESDGRKDLASISLSDAVNRKGWLS